MVDTKQLKPVSANFSATTVTAGSFPAPLPDGSLTVLRATGTGVLFTALTDSDGTTEVNVVADNAAAPATPSGIFISGIHRTVLPTYTTGDAAIFHFDSRGRLLTSAGETGLTADVETDQDPAPATPVGSFSLHKFEATLPTYVDGDAAVFHSDSRGRQILRSAPAATGTTSNVAGSATSVTILAANVARIGAVIFNDSTADLRVKFGTTASSTSFTVKLSQDATLEVPANYTGIIDGIWDTATGNARVTEIT